MYAVKAVGDDPIRSDPVNKEGNEEENAQPGKVPMRAVPVMYAL